MKTLIIIPAYNEQDSIARVVSDVAAAGYDYVVVNDGSVDATPEICRERNLNVINLPRNLGIGGAVQTGHKYALAHGYDVDVQFDGDGQHDISSIPNLLDEIERGADLVVGSRFISAENTFRSTAMRRMGIRWLQRLIKLRTGCTITDATSGFRACGHKAISLFASTYPRDYPEPESIAFGIAHNLKVVEAPAVMHERRGGASSISGFSSVYYMVKVSLAILIAGRKPRSVKRGARR